MPETYTRLTEDERYQIYEGIVHGLSHRAIAQIIHRPNSTVSREMSRNTGLCGYRPRQAQERSQQRQRNKPKFIKLTSEVQALIALSIKKDWSPDQVQGRLKSEGYPIVSGTTIYTFIQNDKHEGGELYKHLRHRKAYKKRTGALEARGQIIGRIPIDERPAIVDEKSRIGDWEADTIIGRGHR